MRDAKCGRWRVVLVAGSRFDCAWDTLTLVINTEWHALDMKVFCVIKSWQYWEFINFNVSKYEIARWVLMRCMWCWRCKCCRLRSCMYKMCCYSNLISSGHWSVNNKLTSMSLGLYHQFALTCCTLLSVVMLSLVIAGWLWIIWLVVDNLLGYG